MAFIRMILLTAILISCTGGQSEYDFDLQGHRGARGLLPENTIPAFKKAVDLGADTIEMDVVVTGDQRILVSHEPWFHHNISSKADGSPVTEEEEKEFNIYEMTVEETQQFDVGKRQHPSFPDQTTMEATKPLLTEAIRTVEIHVEEQGAESMKYNIEIKSSADDYGEYVPHPEEFAMLLNSVLSELDREFDLEDRIIIQSFDTAALAEFRKVNPDVQFAMLVSDDQSMQSYIDELGFTPDVWSPNYSRVTYEMVSAAHERGMKVIPWTVNSVNEMQNLLKLGVDGIITDYPDRALGLK